MRPSAAGDVMRTSLNCMAFRQPGAGRRPLVGALLGSVSLFSATPGHAQATQPAPPTNSDTQAAAPQTAPPTKSDTEAAPPDVIVVTARKRAENVQDIPSSIAVISANTIKEQHITQIDDVSSLVSNLHMVQRNDNSPDVTLRGVGSFGVVQGVGFYVNDVQLFEGQTMRPEDIERIEVLKGPQGTLYGGANIGGAVKYVSKDPTNYLSGEVTGELGSFNARNLSGVVSGPIGSDKLLVRLSGYRDQQDGYIFDTFRQEFYGHTTDYGGRGTLLWLPTEGTKVHLYFNIDRFNSGAQNLLYTPPDDNTYSYQVNDYYVPSFKRKLWSGVAQIDQDISNDVRLTSISAYFHSTNEGITDLAKKPIPIDKLEQDAEHTNYSEELRLASTGKSRFDWLFGLFYQVHNLRFLNIDNFSTGDVNNPVTVAQAHQDDRKHQTEFAGFGNIGYQLGKLKLELGLRLEYYTSREHAFNDGFDPILDASASLNGFETSPRVSLRYKFNPNLNVYATFARGFEPADEIEENGELHPYKAEVAESYEAGFKSTPLPGMTLNGAVFYINYRNRLYQNIQFTPSGLNEVTTNIGPSHNSGVELEMSARLPLNFKISGGFGYTKAVWGNTPFIDPQTNLLINLKGLTAPFTPKYSGNLALDWTQRLGNGLTFGARASGSYTGLSYWDPQDSAKQRPYWLVDLGAYLSAEHWEISGHVSNLTKTRFNTIYAPSYDIGAPFNVAHINRPREFFVTGTVRF